MEFLVYCEVPECFMIAIDCKFPRKAEQPLQGMELQEKKYKKDYRIQKICLERTYS